MQTRNYTAAELLDIIDAHKSYHCNGVLRCVGCDAALDLPHVEETHDDDCKIAELFGLITDTQRDAENEARLGPEPLGGDEDDLPW